MFNMLHSKLNTITLKNMMIGEKSGKEFQLDNLR